MIRRTCPFSLLAIAGLGLFCSALLPEAAYAREDDLPPSVYDAGLQLLHDYVPDEMLDMIEVPTREEWDEFWNLVRHALESQDIEELAWMHSAANMGLNVLRVIPEGRPYADWLQQRLDFFDMANRVTRAVPAPAPAAPPSKAPPPKSKLKPRSVKPPPAPPAVNNRRVGLVRDEDVWRRKIAERPAPANAASLVPKLKPIFMAHGVPPELVWLAEVESSMNPAAKSPVGATGLFQFMPATARRFGMQTEPIDERLIPEKSADAAARYLKILHRQFGSWQLSLAAYNAGEGRVSKLLKSTGGKRFEDITGKLPMETQMYVPKVMATMALREGIDPANLPPPQAERLIPTAISIMARVFN